MTVLIATWEFEGPFENLDHIRDEAGIVAYLTCDRGEWELIDLFDCTSARGSAERLRADRAGDDSSAVGFAVYYCDDLNPALREGLLDNIFKEIDSLASAESESNANPCTDQPANWLTADCTV